MRCKTLCRLSIQRKTELTDIFSFFEEEYNEKEVLANARAIFREEHIAPFYLLYEEERLRGLFVLSFVEGVLAEGSLLIPKEQQGYESEYGLKLFGYVIQELKEAGFLQVFAVSSPSNPIPYLTKKRSEYLMNLDVLQCQAKRPDSEIPLTLDKVTCKDQEFYLLLLSQAFGMKEEFAQERFSACSEDEDIHGFVARRQNLPVGVCSLYVGERSITIFDLAIEKKYQGQGYGTALMMELLTKRLSVGKELLLQVSSESSAAVHLYKKLGFTIKEQLDYYYF